MNTKLNSSLSLSLDPEGQVQTLYDTFHDQRPIWVSDVPRIKVSYFNIEMLNFVWYNCPLTYSMSIYAKNCSISLKIQKMMIFKGSLQVNRIWYSLYLLYMPDGSRNVN